jgi:hypothetical protein
MLTELLDKSLAVEPSDWVAGSGHLLRAPLSSNSLVSWLQRQDSRLSVRAQ